MIPVREGVMRPFITLDIEVHQPVTGPSKLLSENPTVFVGRLKAAMYHAGTVHHFRVVDDGGVMWLVPPGWLSAHSLRKAEMAMDRLDAEFLHILQTVPHNEIERAMARAMDMPEGSTLADMTVLLEQRKLGLVH